MLKRRGANAVEFALTLPFFTAIFLGLVDYGMLFATKAGLDNAVTVACREGAMRDPLFHKPKTIAESVLKARAKPWCDSTTCTYSVDDKFAVPDRTLECAVTLSYNSLIGFVPTPPTISSTSYYRLEWQRQGAL